MLYRIRVIFYDHFALSNRAVLRIDDVDRMSFFNLSSSRASFTSLRIIATEDYRNDVVLDCIVITKTYVSLSFYFTTTTYEGATRFSSSSCLS